MLFVWLCITVDQGGHLYINLHRPTCCPPICTRKSAGRRLNFFQDWRRIPTHVWEFFIIFSSTPYNPGKIPKLGKMTISVKFKVVQKFWFFLWTITITSRSTHEIFVPIAQQGAPLKIETQDENGLFFWVSIFSGAPCRVIRTKISWVDVEVMVIVHKNFHNFWTTLNFTQNRNFPNFGIFPRV